MIPREMSKIAKQRAREFPAMTQTASLEAGLKRYLALQPESIAPTVVYVGRDLPAGKSGIEYRNFLSHSTSSCGRYFPITRR